MIKSRIVIIISLITSSFYIFIDDGQRYDYFVLISSYLISTFCLLQLFKSDNKPYSLNKMFYTFHMFFIGLAPALQFKHNITFWGADRLSSSDYLKMNLIFLLIIFIYYFSYNQFLRKKKLHFLNFVYEKKIKRIAYKKATFRLMLITISLSSFLFFFYTAGFNLLALLVRGGVETQTEFESSKALGLITRIFIRPLPIIVLLIYHFYHKKFDWFEFILILIVLISNAPTGMARFQAASLYIALVIVYLKPVRKGINFSLVLVAGLLYLFPLLSYFRNLDYLENQYSDNDQNIFLKPDFDSYHNFLQLINHDIVTYGNQLFGVFFFFVPRNIWADKPVGSGHFIAEELGLFYDNISMNFFAEGYINFGYFGILLFIIGLAYFNSYFDKLYYSNDKSILLEISFLFLLGMEFLILRGDFLSSFSYTVGISIAVFFVYFLCTRNKLKRSL